MRILISGGTGFLGGAFAQRARLNGCETVTLDVADTADVRCDMGDPAAVRNAVQNARPEVIVHLAALLTTDSQEDSTRAVAVNTLGTAALFTAAAEYGVKRVVYASSVAAVGPCADNSGDDVQLVPGTVYGVTKAFGEDLARVLSGMPNAPAYLALRFGWVYGPGRLRGWREVQEIVERVARGERHFDFPDFPDANDWTWIDDAVEVLIRSLTAALPSFAALNVVGDKRRVRDAIAHLQARFPDLDARPIPSTTPASAWGLVNDRLKDMLGYAPDTPMEKGLDALLAQLPRPAKS
jgi:UDP-glucose 4-epimerase